MQLEVLQQLFKTLAARMLMHDAGGRQRLQQLMDGGRGHLLRGQTEPRRCYIYTESERMGPMGASWAALGRSETIFLLLQCRNTTASRFILTWGLAGMKRRKRV